MLIITIPEQEFFNDKTQEFISIEEHKIEMEHSLIRVLKKL